MIVLIFGLYIIVIVMAVLFTLSHRQDSPLLLLLLVGSSFCVEILFLLSFFLFSLFSILTL